MVRGGRKQTFLNLQRQKLCRWSLEDVRDYILKFLDIFGCLYDILS